MPVTTNMSFDLEISPDIMNNSVHWVWKLCAIIKQTLISEFLSLTPPNTPAESRNEGDKG